MNPETILEKVCRALDIAIGLGANYEGLFPSIIDRSTHQMMVDMPPAIAGQRDGDRSHLGCNLIHDQAALQAMYALARALGRPDYARAADRYLQRFATHCTNTITGIFPWGEHAYWHLVEDRVADSYQLREGAGSSKTTHDHLRQAPLWLWEKLHAFNPDCVERFAEGIDGHWTAGEPLEYIRHAYIDEKRPYVRGARSCDFPRHGGFYIFDWAFAHLQTGRTDFVEQIATMLDYWWQKRDGLGLLQAESRSPADDENFYRINAPGQTLSLGVSLLESAALITGALPDLAARMRERAAVYIEGFLKAPHDLQRGIYVLLSHRDSNEVKGTMAVWGSVYGNWPACYVALLALCGHRLRTHPGLFEWAAAVGDRYIETDFPADINVPAMDAGLGLGLLADLYDLTGETRWLDGGVALAEQLMEIYMDGELPRGASGIDWYESQMGPSFLLHGLARIALLARDGRPCILAADYTAR
jgi:hypothetical protein|tara:strand:- start:319 stop:1737 length:1419 start_codon:yes stop_codon:yes gene_type:complete